MRPYVAFVILGGLVLLWIVMNFVHNLREDLKDIRFILEGEEPF